MPGRGSLVVLRGNSGSGKSTVAKLVQRQFPRGECAVIAQDQIRREILHERDTADGFNIDLIEMITAACLHRGLVVIVEGILDADRYQDALAAVADVAGSACFLAWDLSLPETLRRHQLRPQRDQFTTDHMRQWYQGWQPLNFVDEIRLDDSVSADQAVEIIMAHLGPVTR